MDQAHQHDGSEDELFPACTPDNPGMTYVGDYGVTYVPDPRPE